MAVECSSCFYRMQWTAESCFFVLYQSVFFCLCMKYLGGTAERICAKFTRTIALVPRLDEFEGQG